MAASATVRSASSTGGRSSGWARWAGWAAMGVVVVALLVVGTVDRGPTTDAARARAIEKTIRCPRCSGESVAASDAPIAVSVRNTIERQVREGRSADEIRDFLVAQYGQSVLLDPSSKGFGALVWGVPVFAAVIAVAALALKFGDWQARGERRTTAADRSLVERARRRAAPPS